MVVSCELSRLPKLYSLLMSSMRPPRPVTMCCWRMYEPSLLRGPPMPTCEFCCLNILNLSERDWTISVIFSFCMTEVVRGKMSSADDAEDCS